MLCTAVDLRPGHAGGVDWCRERWKKHIGSTQASFPGQWKCAVEQREEPIWIRMRQAGTDVLHSQVICADILELPTEDIALLDGGESWV